MFALRAVHELGIAAHILEIVRKNLPDGERVKVTRIHLQLGSLSSIVPSALTACMQAVSRGTEAEGAELVFTEMPARARCRDCRAISEVAGPPLTCSSCGGMAVELLSGTESFVASIEIE